MQKQLNKKIEDYTAAFKEGIKKKMGDIGLDKDEKANQLMQYIYDYEHFKVEKDDLVKRKRVKPNISHFDRCCAKRATDEQCTRRKKDGYDYCGTHMKGTPHGVITPNQGEETKQEQKVEVWAQYIQGIIYYIDKFGNVYKAEDVVFNKPNPQIIAKYTKQGETFSIPDLGI
jgi:hypothetical protein